MGIAPSLEKWEDLPSQKIRPEKDVVENVDRDEHEHPAGKNNDGVITRTAFNIKILQKLIFNKYHILQLISLSWWKINIKEGKTKKPTYSNQECKVRSFYLMAQSLFQW